MAVSRMVWSLDGGPGEGGRMPLEIGEPLVSIDECVVASLLTERGAWWADQYGPDGDLFGSRLHLVPGVATAEAVEQVRAYAEEALAWLVQDGLASSVTCRARIGDDVTGQKALVLSVVVDGSTLDFVGVWT